MFGKKKTPENDKMKKKSESVLGKGTSFIGTVKLSENSSLTIKSEIKADIEAFGSNIIVSEEGVIEGIVKSRALENHGQIIGDVSSRKVTMFKNASQKGTLNYLSLCAAEGAVIEGSLIKVS